MKKVRSITKVDAIKNSATSPVLVRPLFSSKFMVGKHSDVANTSGQNDKITVVFKQKIETDEEIKQLIDVLDSMFEAYLVAANRKG